MGYISSTQLFSTISGLGSTVLPSTVNGLGNLGYISSTQLFSTIAGLGSTVLPSTVVGLGSLGYISSSQLVSSITGITNNDQSNITSSLIGLGNIGYLSSFNNISSLNISTGNLFAGSISSLALNICTINTVSLRVLALETVSSISTTNLITTSTLSVDRIQGRAAINNTFTNNLFPASAGAQLGFNSGGTVGGGFYNILAVRSTTTQVIIPSGEAGRFASTIYMFGNISTQNIVTSTLNTSYIDNPISTVIRVQKSLIPDVDNVYTLGTSTQRWQHLYVGPSSIYIGDIASLSADDVGYLYTNVGFGVPAITIGSTKAIYQSLDKIIFTSPVSISTLNTNNISSGGLAVFTTISSAVYSGIESYNYISTTGLQSTIVGLGNVNYVSTSQLISTTTGFINAPRIMTIQTFTF